jgi:hypothetical protein
VRLLTFFANGEYKLDWTGAINVHSAQRAAKAQKKRSKKETKMLPWCGVAIPTL